MLGLFIVRVSQYVHEPLDHRGVIPLQRLDRLLRKVVAQHILGIGEPHALVARSLDSRLAYRRQAGPGDVSAKPGAEAGRGARSSPFASS